LAPVDEKRAERIRDRANVVGRHEPGRRADGQCVQVVQHRVAARLVNLEVTRWMERDRAIVRPLAPNTQRDLLSHRARGHEHGGFFAEFPRDARFEIREPRRFAVAIEGKIGRDFGGDFGQRLVQRAGRMVSQRVRARCAQHGQLGVGHPRRL